jgi:dolichol kinase
MSYAISGALQAAVFAELSGDAALAAIVGEAIYDAVPAGAVPTLYVRFGSETVRDASDISGAGSVHFLTVSVITTSPGFATAKAAAGAVTDALHDADLTLARGHLVSLRFERGSARRIDAASARQIDLRFRARVAGD